MLAPISIDWRFAAVSAVAHSLKFLYTEELHTLLSLLDTITLYLVRFPGLRLSSLGHTGVFLFHTYNMHSWNNGFYCS